MRPSRAKYGSCHGPAHSFEVFADEFSEMERQAHKIASWADNVYVKIPDDQYGRIIAAI